MTDVFSFGEPMVEFCATNVGKLEDVQTFRRGWGGDTSNFAVAVARLGGSCGYVCRIGDDGFGKSLLELWRREGVDASQVVIERGGYTAVYFISLLPDGQHDFTYFRKGSAASHYSPSDLDAESLMRAKLFHTSGITLALSESCREAALKGAEIVKGSGGLFSFDVNYRPKLWPQEIARPRIEEAVAKADLVFASREDFGNLYARDAGDAVERIRSVYEPKLIVIKLGSEGCLVVAGGEKVLVPGFKVAAVDATGAGDAFDGAFVLGFLKGWSLKKTATFANAVGALSTTGLGAVEPIPALREVEDFLRSKGVESSYP
ncbi:MAG: sugar kinase [Candidatus Brockarchaeota archaeon]|nr:sugar kinase [Candidatus Brockarchaeota archaeon]